MGGRKRPEQFSRHVMVDWEDRFCIAPVGWIGLYSVDESSQLRGQAFLNA